MLDKFGILCCLCNVYQLLLMCCLMLTGKLTEESRGASISLPRFAGESPAHDRIIRNSQSDISLNQDGSRPGTNGYGNTWLVIQSLSSV